MNIHEITGSIIDINQNLNTLFADNYIMENDIKDFRKILAGINSNVSGVQSNIGIMIKNTDKLCTIIDSLKDEINTLKNKENGFYDKFVTTFSYGFGVFSSFAIITLIMRKID